MMKSRYPWRPQPRVESDNPTPEAVGRAIDTGVRRYEGARQRVADRSREFSQRLSAATAASVEVTPIDAPEGNPMIASDIQELAVRTAALPEAVGGLSAGIELTLEG